MGAVAPAAAGEGDAPGRASDVAPSSPSISAYTEPPAASSGAPALQQPLGLALVQAFERVEEVVERVA
ncbi:hypothetical protein ABT136_30935, partial [Streptomyces sp. NPDC001856]|uniref:hypothetical protein n=1 Tax=Streptomyces sp. NPDC001856 TaxID=3154399 RepID=UPI003318A657